MKLNNNKLNNNKSSKIPIYVIYWYKIYLIFETIEFLLNSTYFNKIYFLCQNENWIKTILKVLSINQVVI